MNRPEQGGDSASGRLSTRSGRSARRPRVDNPEALPHPPLHPGRTQASASDVTPAASVGTGNRVQWMIDAIQPPMQAWVEAFLTKEPPQVACVCLDRTVPALLDEHVHSAIPSLLDELLPILVRREVVTALATVDYESPSGTALNGAISSAVAIVWPRPFPPKQGSMRARSATQPLRILRKRTLNRSAPHPGSVQWPLTGRVGPFTSHRYMVPQEGPQKMAPVLADTAGPRGTENRLGRFVTEKRQPYRSNRRSAPGAQGYTSEGTENPSEEEDTRRRHGATRKYRDGRHGRYREGRNGRDTRYRDDNRTPMPEVVDTLPMKRTPSRTDREEATAEVVTRASDIGSGETTPT